MKSIACSLLLCAAPLFAAGVKTDAVVLPLAAAAQVLIPAAGSTPGNNGTFYRSDITVINFASHDQAVTMQWLPQGGTETSTTITIPSQSGIRSADFVRDYLNQTGLGAILITGMTAANGVPDTNAELYVNARIWTPEPGTDGTTSQSFPAIPLSSANTDNAALFTAGGSDRPENYRENVGIVNLDANPQTFTISLLNAAGTPQTITAVIPGRSMQQVALGSGLPPTQQILIQNTTATATRSNTWIAYGSTADNVTGDAWSELALPGAPAQ
ncbi:MAG TPA: hypothetical protein VKH35_12340 [Thermoanaerobaculia bacterium]|nr:hypothetical protein [Thermoanaerobaculia bacterium]